MQEALLLIFGPIFLLVVVALLGARLYEKRTKQLRQMADEMGFYFSDKDQALAIELFGPRKGLSLENVSKGQVDGLEVAVFDLHVAIPTMSQMAHLRFTILVFRDVDGNWPSFSLRPGVFRSRLGKNQTGGKRLFEEDKVFSRAYVLETTEETAVREMFNDPVRGFFAKVRGLWIEAENERLYYTRGKLLAAGQLHTFLDEAFRVRKTLLTGDVEHTLR